MRRLALFAVGAAAAILAVAGCGGSDSTSVPAGARAAIFVTDSPREDFAHVWATIYRVELVAESGTAVVAFDDAAGVQIDLRALRDASGERFSFLGSATIPAGTYTGATVAIGETMQFIRNGAAVGDPIAVDANIPRDANGHPVLTTTFRSPRVLDGTSNSVVIDFDLARFVVRESGVLPAIQEGSHAGLGDGERHNHGEYRGVVSGLTGTAPDLTFTFTNSGGRTVTVVTNASTALYGTGTLANGATVAVRGTVDTTTQALVATRVQVLPAGGAPPVGVVGAVADVDAAAGTFTVTIEHARGFGPRRTTVSVATTTETIFRASTGDALAQADFFAALAASPNVEVQGTYDSATNVLTATAARVMDEAFDGWGPRPQNHYRPGMDRPGWGHGMLPD